MHAIGIFDVRTFNMDRNSDNLLVCRGGGGGGAARLVPIDHGYILPSYRHLEVRRSPPLPPLPPSAAPVASLPFPGPMPGSMGMGGTGGLCGLRGLRRPAHAMRH